jgi:SAM-dependent methyltransferase
VSWQQEYLQKFYGPAQGWVDGTTEFHELCRQWIPAGSRILEIGAGPTNRTSQFLASLGELHGVDIDPEALQNDALTASHVVRDDRYPVADASYDACVSNYVAEHIEHPVAHLREVMRVLRPGGAYMLRTPNAYHYVALVSKYTPHWFHKLVANRLRAKAADAHDPYPTFYRMNTQVELRRLAADAGFQVPRLRMVEKEPAYGLAARPLFLGFMAYERLVNASEHASFLRSNIFAALQKPG